MMPTTKALSVSPMTPPVRNPRARATGRRWTGAAGTVDMAELRTVEGLPRAPRKYPQAGPRRALPNSGFTSLRESHPAGDRPGAAFGHAGQNELAVLPPAVDQDGRFGEDRAGQALPERRHRPVRVAARDLQQLQREQWPVHDQTGIALDFRHVRPVVAVGLGDGQPVDAEPLHPLDELFGMVPQCDIHGTVPTATDPSRKVSLTIMYSRVPRSPP